MDNEIIPIIDHYNNNNNDGDGDENNNGTNNKLMQGIIVKIVFSYAIKVIVIIIIKNIRNNNVNNENNGSNRSNELQQNSFQLNKCKIIKFSYK
ncbi:hypothetical protein Glove_132g208 [Diversispora epigaea]|uniref:Uncharacterized protein n=1 Tax=Diversispora epigaea TaxID=1348612 RepID=A0A397J7J8_9GLOM|nr:hypothetical protein Glove_132g208 [Diversispora epigaea]